MTCSINKLTPQGIDTGENVVSFVITPTGDLKDCVTIDNPLSATAKTGGQVTNSINNSSQQISVCPSPVTGANVSFDSTIVAGTPSKGSAQLEEVDSSDGSFDSVSYTFSLEWLSRDGQISPLSEQVDVDISFSSTDKECEPISNGTQLSCTYLNEGYKSNPQFEVTVKGVDKCLGQGTSEPSPALITRLAVGDQESPEALGVQTDEFLASICPAK